MKNVIVIVHVIILICSVGCTEPSERGHKRTGDFQGTNSPNLVLDISLSIASELRLGDRLRFRWQIRNKTKDEVFVYTSLLENTAFSKIMVDNERRTIEIQFTRTEPLNASPYDFPETKLKKLRPDEGYSGEFTSDVAVAKLSAYSGGSGQISHNALKSGAWQIRMCIGYGENEPVLKNADYQADSHVVNRVVSWQKLAFSPYKSIELR